MMAAFAVALGRADPGSSARSCQQRRTLFYQTARARCAHLYVVAALPEMHGFQFSDRAGVSAIDGAAHRQFPVVGAATFPPDPFNTLFSLLCRLVCNVRKK
jgi:hypothetical protein